MTTDSLLHCKDCVNWVPIDSFGGDSPGELERLGKCVWIQGVFMANDFCSKAKRCPPAVGDAS